MSHIKKGIHIFIQQGGIKLIKSDSKDIYVRKTLFQINAVLLNLICIKMYHSFHKYTKLHRTAENSVLPSQE